ncbi:DEAD/DEAH box helicase [Halomicrobium urmianum]|uniref:DEAD/DEAH box helicase n=1 Tax=Halomicrobium urmianum TaxID=1586233 RepID=UPI001CD9B981|nr:helicase-related protein [Halomicrobium urmianum]
MRSFVQSNDGADLRSESAAFDAFASALLARKPLRWNTMPDLDAIASLVAEHAPAQKTVVLVRSYDAAAELAEILTDQYDVDTDDLAAFTDSGDDRIETVEQFNQGQRGVIVGPGDLLGTGVDMPDAEVAVNVSRGGVNASLVQRIGRVLRNPTGDKEALFYHLVAQPLEDDAIDAVEDGAKILEHAAAFRALGETFREPPMYRAHGNVTPVLVELENSGIELLERIDDESQLVDDDRAHEFVRALQARVYDANEALDDPLPETSRSSKSGRAPLLRKILLTGSKSSQNATRPTSAIVSPLGRIGLPKPSRRTSTVRRSTTRRPTTDTMLRSTTSG